MSKKDAYIEKAQAKIDEQTARLNRLKAQVKGEVASQKIEAYERIEKLESTLKAAKSRLKEVTDSAGEAWKEEAKRFESLADELGASFKKFFSNKGD